MPRSATTSARESLEIAEAWGTPGARGIALHTCARVSDLDVEMLRSASLLLADSPLRLEGARAELRAGGIRVQRKEATGADALTPSERRIAELAASGLSNPAIAQELFLTVKTIEMHLTRAYRKLDVRRRSELPGAL